MKKLHPHRETYLRLLSQTRLPHPSPRVPNPLASLPLAELLARTAPDRASPLPLLRKFLH